MEWSDDPVTAIIAGASIFGAVQAGKAGERPESIKAEQAQETAEPTVALSEQAKRNRRLAASSLTKKWAEPKLGTPGLLGA